MIDFEKAGRQIMLAKRKTTSEYRLQLISHIGWAYVHLADKDRKNAQNALRAFDDVAARHFGWFSNSGAGMPRPFSHRHMEQLYWNARKEAFGESQPRRVYVPRPKVSFNDWMNE